MKKLKILFVGIGSIAKRHIHNLLEVSTERGLSLQIDAYRHTNTDERIEGTNNIYTNISLVPGDYDIIFITNPTSMHLPSLVSFKEKGKHFFIEKPVVAIEQVNAAKKISFSKDSLVYIAAPLRYNAVIQYVKNSIDIDKVISIRSISSSYLPDWRPGKKYMETYSAHKQLGGGVSIDLIHEWDYLTYIFGWPKKVSCMIGKKSNLLIDSDDYAIYIGEYSDKIVELHLDYFGRKNIRKIELIMEEETIIGDIANNQVYFLVADKTICFDENRDSFQKRELNHFIDMVLGNKPTENGFYHGLKVLGLTQGII